jgi:cytoplasmic iron level regulating protein YaaA (DUF328/UPF0246 family)
MLLIISPAKNLSSKPHIYKYSSSIAFSKESEKLASVLKKMKAKQLSDLMQISPKLGELNYERYQKWSYPFSGKDVGSAIFMFQGDVYKGLQAEIFNEDEMDFAQHHLRILSGLYGVLKPLDIIAPYRLEASTVLESEKGKDLYAFWGSKISKNIALDMKEQNDRILINLASAEYFKLIKPKELKAEIITPIFKEFKDGEFKQIAILAKKARGMMCRFIIRNKLTSPEELKGFDYENYGFNEALSSKKEFVFTR